MKRTSCIILLIVFSTSLPAMATPRIGIQPEGICTRDINPWGQASHCSCSGGNMYDERSGLCLQGDAAQKIMVQGTVSTGIMAIGGESTGTVIKTSEGLSYELILKSTDQQKVSQSGTKWCKIEGELITMEGVEINDRKIIIADTVTLSE